MNEIFLIKDQLEKAFYGCAWHGPSVIEVLNGISSDKAIAKPINGAHSIWDIVLHISAWQNAVFRRLHGDPANLTDEEDWQQATDASEAAWAKESNTLPNFRNRKYGKCKRHKDNSGD